MTALYPRERVESVLRPLSIASAHRILLKPHLAAPLAVHPSKSRFCDGRTYAVRNQAAGRALSRALYEQHSDIDGIWYQSRLTGGDCLAIFDRVLNRLKPLKRGQLEHHPKLPDVLRAHSIKIDP